MSDVAREVYEEVLAERDALRIEVETLIAENQRLRRAVQEVIDRGELECPSIWWPKELRTAVGAADYPVDPFADARAEARDIEAIGRQRHIDAAGVVATGDNHAT